MRPPLIALLLLLCLAGCRRGDPPPLRVAAAADLQGAFTALGGRFAKESGRGVVFTFQASGVLREQARRGAPFDVLALAQRSLLDPLDQAGLIVPGSRTPLGRGRLALWSPARLTRLEDLKDPARARRIGIANPEHAPYGAAAVAALRRAGLYEALRPRLVISENVRQALQLGETGHVDAALVALSLCPRAAACAALPEALHPPIEQEAAALRGGDEEAARRFLGFLRGPTGQAVLAEHGFASGPALE